MKAKDYMRSSLTWLLCTLFIVVMINAVLFTSTTLEKSWPDILYLNILMLFVWLFFFMLGFIRAKKRYHKLRLALNENNSADALLPDDDSFFSTLIRDMVQVKNNEHFKALSRYKNDIEELHDYITKWVHEVKIPISVTELMIENSDDISVETARNFKTELERLKFLVNQVLYAGRAAHYHEDLAVKEFNLQKVVREALKLNSYFLMSKNIEVSAGSLDFDIISDEKWVTYILEQILNNSSKYVRQDGKVEIHAKDFGKSIQLKIRDNGIGIPSQDLHRVFDKGFTGENGRKTSRSTGMGLYYSKKVAEMLGIGLDANSAEGEYTEFALTFPKLNDYLNVTKI